MKRKIFISLDIPEKAKKRLVLTTEKWKDLPVKLTKEKNLHLTLAFLGFVPEENILEICEKVQKAAAKKDSFDITFDKIALFPDEKDPRAIALLGEPSDQLLNLVNDLEKNLGISRAPKKSFRAHITLGRLRKIKWEALSEKPEVLENFSLSIPVETVDIMASGFSEGEREYTLIESCPLE